MSLSNETQIGFQQRMISSSLGSIVSAISMTPFDVLKIRLHKQARPDVNIFDCIKMNNLCLCPSSQSNYLNEHLEYCFKYYRNHNTWSMLTHIVKKEGVLALWKGLSPTLLFSVPHNVSYYSVYDTIKIHTNQYFDLNNLSTSNDRRGLFTPADFVPMGVAAVARIVVLSVFSPIELIRTKFMSSSKPISYRRMGKILYNARKESGLLSLWRGFMPSLYRDVPFSMIFWFAYEYQLRQFLESRPADRQTSQVLKYNFLFGAVAGGVAGIVTLPFDVVKTQRQIEIGEKSFHINRNKSMWNLLRQIYQRQGVPGLFAGSIPRILKVSPACSIMIGSYEFCKAYLFSDLTGREI